MFCLSAAAILSFPQRIDLMHSVITLCSDYDRDYCVCENCFMTVQNVFFSAVEFRLVAVWAIGMI